MVMSRYQNAGGSHKIKVDYISFERVEEFKYLGTNLSPRGLHPKGVLTLVRKIGGPALCNSLSAVWAAESRGRGLLWG